MKSDLRDAARREKIRYAIGASSLGDVLVAASESGICAISLGDAPEPLIDELKRRFPKAAIAIADDGFAERIDDVIAFVETPRGRLDLPLDMRGTPFQRRVWEALRAIPAGQTRSYADIAQSIGAPRATRAVAGACAANPIAVAVPCHRVVHKDGTISGYAGGVPRKRKLLAREGAPKLR